MKAAQDACSIRLREQDYKDLIEGIDSIDPSEKVEAELRRYEDLRVRLIQGKAAANQRGSAASIETNLT